MEKEFNLSEKLEQCLKQLGIDLEEGNLTLTQIISDFKEVLTEYHKEFIKRLHIELCAMLEGEILLKKKDIRRVYAIIDKLAGKSLI